MCRVLEFCFFVVLVILGDFLGGHRVDVVSGEWVVLFDKRSEMIKRGFEVGELDPARLFESGRAFSQFIRFHFPMFFEEIFQVVG